MITFYIGYSLTWIRWLWGRFQHRGVKYFYFSSLVTSNDVKEHRNRKRIWYIISDYFGYRWSLNETCYDTFFVLSTHKTKCDVEFRFSTRNASKTKRCAGNTVPNTRVSLPNAYPNNYYTRDRVRSHLIYFIFLRYGAEIQQQVLSNPKWWKACIVPTKSV